MSQQQCYAVVEAVIVISSRPALTVPQAPVLTCVISEQGHWSLIPFLLSPLATGDILETVSYQLHVIFLNCFKTIIICVLATMLQEAFQGLSPFCVPTC